MGGGVSTNHKSSNGIELSWLGQQLLNLSDLTWSHPSTHPPIHPPTKSCTHLWVGISPQNFKSLNGIEISWLVQVLLNFDRFQGSPWGSGRWVDGDGIRYGCIGGCPMHTCMQAHMHVCMHTHVKHDKHGYLHVGGHLQFLYMHMHACACMWWHPPCSQMLPDTPHPSAPFPELQEAQNTKTQ